MPTRENEHELSGLENIRIYYRIPMADLADRLMVSTVTYARYEQGKSPISFAKAKLLARLLNVTLDDLSTWRSEDELFHHLGPNLGRIGTLPGEQPQPQVPASQEPRTVDQLRSGNSDSQNTPASAPRGSQEQLTEVEGDPLKDTLDELEARGWGVD